MYAEYKVQTQDDARTVIHGMNAVIGQLGSINLEEFHNLLGLPSAHSDTSKHWYSTENVDLIESTDGWVIRLPEPDHE